MKTSTTSRRQARRVPTELWPLVRALRGLLGAETYAHGEFLTWRQPGRLLLSLDLAESRLRLKFGPELTLLGEWDDMRDQYRVAYQLEHTIRIADNRLAAANLAVAA